MKLKRIERVIRQKKWNLEELDRKKQIFQGGEEQHIARSVDEFEWNEPDGDKNCIKRISIQKEQWSKEALGHSGYVG